MNSRKASSAVIPPGNPDRGNSNFTNIIAQSLWFVEQMPQGYRHGEEKRNEMFLMNVTPQEFAFLSCKTMRDFRRARLGKVAYTTGTHDRLSPDKNLWPMFATLSRSQRLAKRERKLNGKSSN